MRIYRDGTCTYQGRTYATLRDALLMALACIAIVLMVLMALMGTRPVKLETEAATAESAPTLDTNVVVLAAPELIVAPEPVPTSEPDKPTYSPAVPLSEDLQYILLAACAENCVDPAIALGLIEVESRFDPDADNGLCYGLMQLNRRYFPDSLPPGENIRCGVEYLGQLLNRYGTVEAALTAYNAGHDTGSRRYANAVLVAAKKWRETDRSLEVIF